MHTQGSVYSKQKQVCIHKESVKSKNNQVRTHKEQISSKYTYAGISVYQVLTHTGFSRCNLITRRNPRSQGSVYSNDKPLCTHTHRDQCILATNNYALTQGTVYFKNKLVRTHIDQSILMTSKYRGISLS